MRMRHIVIRSLPRSIIFSHIISQKVRFSEKKVTEHKMCVLVFLQLLFETFPILRRTERDMVYIYIGLHAK